MNLQPNLTTCLNTSNSGIIKTNNIYTISASSLTPWNVGITTSTLAYPYTINNGSTNPNSQYYNMNSIFNWETPIEHFSFFDMVDKPRQTKRPRKCPMRKKLD